VELISAHERDLDGDALLKSCYLFDEHDCETPLQDVPVAVQRTLFCITLVSKLHGTCIPTSSNLSYLRCSLKPPSRDFERPTGLKVSSFCRNVGTVKLLLAPGKAGGLPKGNYLEYDNSQNPGDKKNLTDLFTKYKRLICTMGTIFKSMFQGKEYI